MAAPNFGGSEAVCALADSTGAPITSANPLPTAAGASTAKIGTVGERFITASAALTRPANTTAYSANDAVTDTGGTATVVSLTDTNDDPQSIEAIRINTADTGFGTAAGGMECWVYNAATTPAANHAAFTSNQSGLVGRFSGTWIATSDGSFVVLTPVEGSRRICKPLTGAKTVNLTFKTLAAVTPSASSSVLNILVEGFQGRA